TAGPAHGGEDGLAGGRGGELEHGPVVVRARGGETPVGEVEGDEPGERVVDGSRRGAGVEEVTSDDEVLGAGRDDEAVRHSRRVGGIPLTPGQRSEGRRADE